MEFRVTLVANVDTILYFERVLSAKSLPKWTSNYCIWLVAKWQRCWIIFWMDIASMIIIDDDGWLLSPDKWIQWIILWEIALMSSRFCWFHETSPARNSPLLLAVLDSKVLHMNKYWATFSGYFFMMAV